MARSKPETKIESKKKAPVAVKPVKEVLPVAPVAKAPASVVPENKEPASVVPENKEPEMKVEEQQLISMEDILSKPESELVTMEELRFVDSVVIKKQQEATALKELYNKLSRRYHSNYRVPSLEECLKQSQNIAPSQAELIAQERRSMVKRSMGV